MGQGWKAQLLRAGTRGKGRWGWAGVMILAADLALGCSESLPPCPEFDTHVVPLPSATFEPALTNHYLDDDPEALFEGSFPGGAVSPNVDVDPDEVAPGGTAVPSARLVIDREARVLIRSYIDDQGRTVEERWTMTPTELP